MKPCKICGANIPQAAIKCLQCGSFQNWKRYIHFSTTVLALLVALVSVVTTATPVLRSMFIVHDSDINIVYKNYNHTNSGLDKGKLLFIIVNSGARSGGLGDVYLTYSIDNMKVNRADDDKVRQRKNKINKELLSHFQIDESDINSLTVTLHVNMSLFDADEMNQKLVFLKPGTSYLLQLKPDSSGYASFVYESNDKSIEFKKKQFKYIFNGLLSSGALDENNAADEVSCVGYFKIINFSGEETEKNIQIDCVDVKKIMFAAYHDKKIKKNGVRK